MGIAWAIDFPSRRTVLFTLVGTKRVTNAVSLESVSMQGTKIVGPVVGGVMLANLGPVWCYLLLAALYVVAICSPLAGARVPLPVPTRSDESILGGLATGFKEAREQPAILGVLVITIIMNGLVFPYQQILPVFARDVLDVGPELLGLLVAAGGVGNLIGALWTAGRRNFAAHRQVFVVGSMMAALLVVVQSFSPAYLTVAADPVCARHRRVRLQHDAEHHRAAGRPRAGARPGAGHPLGLHRDQPGRRARGGLPVDVRRRQRCVRRERGAGPALDGAAAVASSPRAHARCARCARSAA